MKYCCKIIDSNVIVDEYDVVYDIGCDGEFYKVFKLLIDRKKNVEIYYCVIYIRNIFFFNCFCFWG